MMSHFLRPLMLLVFLTGVAVVSVKASNNVIGCEYDNFCQATQKLMATVNEIKNQQDERGGVQATDLEELKVKLDRSLASTAVISTQLEEHSGDLLSHEECLKAKLVCPMVNEKLETLAANMSHIHSKQVKDAEELKRKLDICLSSTSVISTQLEKHSAGLMSLEELLKAQNIRPDVNAMFNKLDAKASDMYSKQVKDVEELKVKLERSLASMAAISTQLETLSSNLLRHDERLKTHDVSQTDLHKAMCPPGFTYLPSVGSCYKVVFERDDWHSAGRKCQGLRRGSHLAAITSAAENTAVKTFLASELSKNVGKTHVCISSDYDFRRHGEWFWTSGQRLDGRSCNSPFVWKPWSDTKLSFEFSNWVSGQPDCWRNMEYCVNIWPKFNFGWNDAPCTTSICSICEYNP